MRSGGGTRGNVPANALALLEENAAAPGELPSWQSIAGVAARNPMPAAGGEEPTPLDSVRRDAPEAYRRRAAPRRAAGRPRGGGRRRSPLVERAVARRAWSGSWPVIATVVDLGSPAPTATPRRAAAPGAARRPAHARHRGGRGSRDAGRALHRARGLRAPGAPSPSSCAPTILRVLRPGTDSRPGFFHPSRLPLGRPVYLSSVVAAVAALPAVDAVGYHRGAASERAAVDGARGDHLRARRGGGARRRPRPARARAAGRDRARRA